MYTAVHNTLLFICLFSVECAIINELLYDRIIEIN